MDDGVIGGSVDVTDGEEVFVLPGGWSDLDLNLGLLFLFDLSFCFGLTIR